MRTSFLRHLISKTCIPFSESTSRVHFFTAIEEDGSGKTLVELELAREADGVAPPDPV